MSGRFSSVVETRRILCFHVERSIGTVGELGQDIGGGGEWRESGGGGYIILWRRWSWERGEGGERREKECLGRGRGRGRTTEDSDRLTAGVNILERDDVGTMTAMMCPVRELVSDDVSRGRELVSD